MPKRIKAFSAIWLLTTGLLGLTLVACGASAPGGGQCDRDGLCIDVELQEPIRMNEPVGVTIVVESEEDLSDLQVFLEFSDPDITVVDGTGEWVIDIIAGESVQLSTAIQFPEEGAHDVLASVLHPPSRTVLDYVPVRITTLGGTTYPGSIRTPGVPIPVEPVTPTVSPQALLPDALAPPLPTGEQVLGSRYNQGGENETRHPQLDQLLISRKGETNAKTNQNV